MLKILMLFTLTSCTISFQNISTHGSATDLADDNLTTTPNVAVTIPIKPL